MLRYINNQLLQDPLQQQQLETQLSAHIQQHLPQNIAAFRKYQPALLPLLQGVAKQYFIFCTRAGEMNITDCTNGRVLYGECPSQEATLETQSFCSMRLTLILLQHLHRLANNLRLKHCRLLLILLWCLA